MVVVEMGVMEMGVVEMTVVEMGVVEMAVMEMEVVTAAVIKGTEATMERMVKAVKMIGAKEMVLPRGIRIFYNL